MPVERIHFVDRQKVDVFLDEFLGHELPHSAWRPTFESRSVFNQEAGQAAIQAHHSRCPTATGWLSRPVKAWQAYLAKNTISHTSSPSVLHPGASAGKRSVPDREIHVNALLGSRRLLLLSASPAPFFSPIPIYIHCFLSLTVLCTSLSSGLSLLRARPNICLGTMGWLLSLQASA